MPMVVVCLSCTVRGCGRPLARRGAAWTCDAGHAFDIARAGYVNLLQPQDRRARVPGDPAEAVAARERSLARGLGTTILTGVADEVRRHLRAREGVVVDLGAGTGELLCTLVAAGVGGAIGIELSSIAITRAVRRCPDATWVVANADRRLPLADGCADVVLSVHARRNPAECARVLARDGRLIVVVPAPDDLIELRTVVGGAPIERTRVEGVVKEHAERFDVTGRARLEERHELDRPALTELLHATYRGARRSAADRLASLRPMHVTLASDMLTLRLR